MLEQFKKTGKEALSELKKISDMSVLEQFRIKYLSRKARITQLLGEIVQVIDPPEAFLMCMNSRPVLGTICPTAAAT